jgi:hypothetical protein
MSSIRRSGRYVHGLTVPSEPGPSRIETHPHVSNESFAYLLQEITLAATGNDNMVHVANNRFKDLSAPALGDIDSEHIHAGRLAVRVSCHRRRHINVAIAT